MCCAGQDDGSFDTSPPSPPFSSYVGSKDIQWRTLRRGGWTRLKELRNILVFVHPLFRTSGKIFIFIRHLALKCLSFRVVKLLRPLSRFLRSEAPMSRISQKLGHSRHSGSIHTGGGGYETSSRERHIQRQSRPSKRPIRAISVSMDVLPRKHAGNVKAVLWFRAILSRRTIGRELRGGFQETVGRKSGDSEKKRGHRDGVGTVAPATDLCCLGEVPVATKPTKSAMADFKARWIV